MSAQDAATGLPTNLTRRSILTFVGMLGLAGCIAILFLSMRSVMDIGGVCASGNTPFEPRVQCPSGVPGLLTGSVMIGLVFLGLYAVNTFGINLTLLAWPALFLSLGWNFMEYGINPPEPAEGLVWGWLICGVLFIAMGGIPLVVGIKWALDGRESRINKSPDQDKLKERMRLPDFFAPQKPPEPEERIQNTRRFAIGLQIVAIAVGIWTGVQVFEAVTGSNVSVGFR